jgi:hypothetical protein
MICSDSSSACSRPGIVLKSIPKLLELEPACAETQVQTPVADVVERRRHLRRDAWVAVRVAIDHRADARAFGLLAERGKRGPSFEARAGRVGNEDWIEVIEAPQRVVAPTVGVAPQLFQVFPLDQLLTGLNSESNWMLWHCEPS